MMFRKEFYVFMPKVSTIRTRADIESFLSGRINLERMVSGRTMRLDLDPIRKLLDAVGNPQERFLTAHVAGTVGKGSTAHFLSVFLRRLGLRTGLYTSPHVVRINERIQIGGEEISEKELAEALQQLAPHADACGASYFDLLTAAAFVHFSKREVHAAVVEVGLGGRVDSTNVILPGVSVITSIGTDHSDVLGASSEAKAREKGGIIKNGVAVVSGVDEGEAAEVIEQICCEKQAPLWVCGRDFHFEAETKKDRRIGVTVKTRKKIYAEQVLPTPALYQAKNFALALAALERLAEKEGWDVTRCFEGDEREFAMKGRMEIFAADPLIVLDGAHMSEAVSAVVESLKQFAPEGPKSAVFSAAADKDALSMLKALQAWTDTVFMTAPRDNPRAVSPFELASLGASLGLRTQADPSAAEAFAKACQSTRGGVVLVTGSFYLVGEIRTLLSKG